MTRRLTDEAVEYIKQHGSGGTPQKAPFFLYMAYLKVHTALFTSPAFANRSGVGGRSHFGGRS